MRIVALLSLFPVLYNSQTIDSCRERFNYYFNHRGQLSGLVRFDKEAITLYAGGKKELAIYENEIGAMAAYFAVSDRKEQRDFLKRKGQGRLSKRQTDSLIALRPPSAARDSNNLRGVRIAIDPGHFGITREDADIERKFLHFTTAPGDTVQLYESSLTFATAMVLAGRHRALGAEVAITRNQAGHTSFDCTYREWLRIHKRRVLDSLVAIKKIPEARRSALMRMDPKKFYHEYFRDAEILNRAARINSIRPDATVIIHYNVDERNAPWKRTTKKNYTMAFIPGAFTPSDLQKEDNRTHLVRWLISPDFEASRMLAGLTVKYFNRNLGVRVATAADAVYLKSNCLYARVPGVYCRNLVLCRTVNSPLVYGESLYQDNEEECKGLMRCDLDLYGVKTNSRVEKVAESYFEALVEFFKASR
jgi:hypothetical protein